MMPAVRVSPPPGLNVHELDAVVVGAGGAGLYAALELKKDLGPKARVGVITKLYPSRSHTGAAQGGVCAALGNLEEDHWEWHMFDTVKGGDYLVDQDAAQVMCHDAIDTIYMLEHMGLPFNRTPEGKIDQRPRLDRRPDRHRLPARRAAGGHGVLSIPPDRPLRHRHPALGGGARRGRHPAQQPGRALHGALRPALEGPGAARHGLALHLP